MRRMDISQFQATGVNIVKPHKKKIGEGCPLVFERGGFASGVLLPLPEEGYFGISRRLYRRFCDDNGVGYANGHTVMEFHKKWLEYTEPELNHVPQSEFRRKYAHFLNLAEYRGEDYPDAYTIITREATANPEQRTILVPPSVGLEMITVFDLKALSADGIGEKLDRISDALGKGIPTQIE